MQHLRLALPAHRAFARQFFHPALRRAVTPWRGRLPLLFTSQVAWDTVWQRPQEQALGLARQRPVVFFSPVQLHEWTGRLAQRWRFARTLEGGRLLVLSPLILSGEYRSAEVRRLNSRLLVSMVRRLFCDHPFMYLTNTPFYRYLIDGLHPRAVVYDVIDDFCAFSWAPSDGRAEEERLLEQANLVLAGTGSMQAKYERPGQPVQYLPSGVRYEALTAAQREPADLRELPRPRLLYVGTLNDRLDGSLFRTAAQAVPHGSVVVVGPRHGTFAAPELPTNVHFLGLKPHTELAGYYQHCDLGLMPFADNDAARAINPIKTLEYLACGLPVLSTPVPDVVRFYAEHVRVAKASQWAMVLEEMLKKVDLEGADKRRCFAQGRSWDALVEHLQGELLRLEAGS